MHTQIERTCTREMRRVRWTPMGENKKKCGGWWWRWRWRWLGEENTWRRVKKEKKKTQTTNEC